MIAVAVMTTIFNRNNNNLDNKNNKPIFLSAKKENTSEISE